MEVLGKLLDWLFQLPQQFIDLWSWLNIPLPYINLSPLLIISAGGIITICGFLVLRLVIGG